MEANEPEQVVGQLQLKDPEKLQPQSQLRQVYNVIPRPLKILIILGICGSVAAEIRLAMIRVRQKTLLVQSIEHAEEEGQHDVAHVLRQLGKELNYLPRKK